MDFSEYQKQSRDTARYPVVGQPFVYPTLGLTGEAGEVAEKVKKIMRDKNGVVDDEAREAIKKELGDVLWYLAQIATELGLELKDIAADNIEKLQSRKRRNLLHGEGDNR